MRPLHAPLLALALASTLVTTAALADDKAACLDAASSGQTLRDAHKLVEARDRFRACARAECPSVVQTSCTEWLETTEKSLPTVVVTAKDGAGADLVDVTVDVDGQRLLTRLEGHAVPMNPGPHAFHLELADGTSVDQQVVVREGEKDQPISAVLGKPAAPPVAPAGPPASAPATPSAGGTRPWATVGWILGGVGVVGLGVGTAFGVVAMSDKNSANCVGNLCDAGPIGSAKSAATISDIGLIAGGVLFAGGVTLVLLSRDGAPSSAATLSAAPVLGSRGGGLALGGHW
jgi:hypothetical protein